MLFITTVHMSQCKLVGVNVDTGVHLNGYLHSILMPTIIFWYCLQILCIEVQRVCQRLGYYFDVVTSTTPFQHHSQIGLGGIIIILCMYISVSVPTSFSVQYLLGEASHISICVLSSHPE